MEYIYLSAALFSTMTTTMFKRIFTAAALCISLWAATNSAAQEQLRPYEKWEATQFVALSGHQPIDYVTADNNWKITYNLRTPQTAGELRGKDLTKGRQTLCAFSARKWPMISTLRINRTS